MKILIVTQKVDINDPILGFFHRWLEEFSKNCESVTVVCLYRGEYNLPANVKVFSLGKEEGISRLKYLFRFFKYIRQEKNNYDNVFVHMNPVYVILGGLFWRAGKKKVGLWYAHKSVDWKLRIAEKIIDVIFTPSVHSFRLPSVKVKIMGHGIDVSKFKCNDSNIKKNPNLFKIVTAGRISPIKDYETLFKAIELLNTKDNDLKIKVDIIGMTISIEDEKYLASLKVMINEKGLENTINFIGPVPNKDIISYLCSSDLFVNMSHTGSLDKAILEAMSSGLPILTSNESFLDIADQEDAKIYFFNQNDYAGLSERIRYFYSIGKDQRMTVGGRLRKIVSENHNLEILIPNIIKFYEGF